MITSAKLNRAIFATRSFDSGAMGQMLSVVHPFNRPGRYLAVVRRRGQTVGQTEIEVTESAGRPQLTIDLAAVASRGRAASCECDDRLRGNEHTVSSGGYVLFTVLSGEGGFSVVVGEPGGQGKPVFDSERLEKDDLFALTLLEPGKYLVANQHGSARGTIGVSFRPEDAKKLRTLKTLYVEVAGGRLDPAEIKITSTQGLVFRVSETARIVIERQPEPKTSGPRKPPRKLRYLRPTHR
jgi:hypothetical protein